jgi:SPP1 gp7 family putative phage head morphogenesis protein
VRDDHDNLKPDGVVRITQPQINQNFPASKFILYSYRKRYEDLFGTSLIRSLYDLWWLKHVLKRAMGVYFERAGTPVATAKYPNGMSEIEQNKLFQLVKAIRFESAVVLPKEVELEFTESKGRNEVAFITAIKHIDEQIVKTILGQTLTQSHGEGGLGSKALGGIHKDVMVMYVEELGRDIATKVVRDQIIKDLIDFNFPNPIYPKFAFKPIAPEDETARVDAFLNALGKGAVMATMDDENEIRRILGFGDRDPAMAVLVKPLPPQFGGDGLPPTPGQPTDLAPGSDPAKAPKPGDKPALAPTKGESPSGKPGEPLAPKAPAAKLQERIFTGVRRRSYTKAEERVDFAEVLNTIEGVGVDDIMADVAPLLVEAQEDILAQVQRKKIIENQDTKAIADIAIRNLGAIKAALRDGLVRVARRGRKSATGEMAAAKREMKMAEPTNIARFLPAEVEKFFVDRAFHITKVVNDQILGLAKNSLFASIKNGVDLRTAMAGLKDVMQPYVDSGMVDPVVAGGPRLEIIVRTNVVDAFNVSRLETFKANTDFVKGLEYSAILDDRVRDDHAAMDGRQYAIDDAIWDRWTPPNGFNCRCVLIPVTLADIPEDGKFTPSKPPPASVQPDAGFKENGE